MNEAEKLAERLRDIVTKYRFVSHEHGVIDGAAAILRRQAEQIKVLREALQVARDFMSIASDWNLDEAEINGEMRGTYDWLEVIDAALAATKEET